MNTDHREKERYRGTAVVPATLGDYVVAVTVGVVGQGQAGASFNGVTVLIEQCPTLAKVELWLPQVADGTLSAANRTAANYFYAGLCVTPVNVAFTAVGETVTYGSASWPLAGWPGAQIRIRNGGGASGGGNATISVTAY